MVRNESLRPQNDGQQDWNHGTAATISDGLAPDGTWVVRRYIGDGLILTVYHDDNHWTDIRPDGEKLVTHIVSVRRIIGEDGQSRIEERTLKNLRPGRRYVLRERFIDPTEPSNQPLKVIVRRRGRDEAQSSFLAHTPYQIR